MLLTLSMFRTRIVQFSESLEFISDNLSDCQMSHRFLSVISQVENAGVRLQREATLKGDFTSAPEMLLVGCIKYS